MKSWSLGFWFSAQAVFNKYKIRNLFYVMKEHIGKVYFCVCIFYNLVLGIKIRKLDSNLYEDSNRSHFVEFPQFCKKRKKGRPAPP